MDTTDEDIRSLINLFYESTYRTCYDNAEAEAVLEKCIQLATLDYNTSLVDNSGGTLCGHYPSKLIIFESEKDTVTNQEPTTSSDKNHLRELITYARIARCRTRFPIPVILFEGKNICRSSTLSGVPEIYSRSSFELIRDGLAKLFGSKESKKTAESDEEEEKEETDEEKDDMNATGKDNKDVNSYEDKNNELEAAEIVNQWMLCHEARKDDIRLLKYLNVETIFDLMTEGKKIKYGMKVSSSEKVDKEKRYKDFTIVSVPYPGCEFFEKFRERNYTADGLYFNWKRPEINAKLNIPLDTVTVRLSQKLNLNWFDYKKWDLANLTKNYLTMILAYLFKNNSGLLVHCISGWDRTPLFISLLRICLWADGLIHKSLTVKQMLYFTIGYDWFLFGHNFRIRKDKGEDIFFFCFYFLKFLKDNESSCYKKGEKLIPYEKEEEIGEEHTRKFISTWRVKNKQEKPIVEETIDLDNLTSTVCFGDSPSDHEEDSDSSEYEMYEVPMDKFSADNSSPVDDLNLGTVGNKRKRHDSSSSWKNVTITGSSYESDDDSIIRAAARANAAAADGEAPSTSGVQPSSIEGSGSHPQDKAHYKTRGERLNEIRDLFIYCYCNSVGHKYKDGSDASYLNIVASNISDVATGVTNMFSTKEND